MVASSEFKMFVRSTFKNFILQAPKNLFDELKSILDGDLSPEIVQILEKSGFDTKIALMTMDEEAIFQIENYVRVNREILKNTSYENDLNFQFKPGHRRFILELAKKAALLFQTKSKDVQESDFSFVLKMLIETAQRNSERDPKGYRYSESIRYFATYVYILCGKACYETLSENLPIPKAQTICMYFVRAL